MKTFIGIDPGARYTGVSVRKGDEVLLSSTYVRPQDMLPVTWAVYVVDAIRDEVISQFPEALIGIENVTIPNTHNGGKLNLMNPKPVIHLALVVGALATAFPDAVIVRPGKNGSQEKYPAVLEGRRPKDLPGESNGAGTRNHERSAYDVAGIAEILHRDHYKLDTQNNLFDL